MGCTGSKEHPDSSQQPTVVLKTQNSGSNLLTIQKESYQSSDVVQSKQTQQQTQHDANCSHVQDKPQFISKAIVKSAPESTATSVESIQVDVVDQETKRRNRIDNIRAELLSTEQSYVKNLTTAMEVIMLPIIDKKIMDPETAADQFNDFIAIAKFNKIMLDEFEALPLELVATMRKYVAGLKMYASYLQHFERRMHVRAKLVNNNALHTFFEQAREQHHGNLESFLVEPVQRIPRYKMLLTELQSRMKPGDIEYDIIDAAVAEVSNMAMHNNDAISEMEQRLETNASMMKVVNLTRINVFDDPTRHLLMWSFNLKCSSAGSTLKPLQIWLFNDKIIYGRNVTKKKIFSCTRYLEIPLMECNVVSTADDEEDESNTTLSSFIIESERESFLVIAKSVQERNEWLDAIMKAIDARRGVSRRLKSGSFLLMAPVWKLDDASNICDLCSRQFGVLNRRHHCRLCGALVCDPCSDKRVSLQHEGISHTWSTVELNALSAAELDRMAKHDIEKVRHGSVSGPVEKKKERVCTLCYNNLSCQYVQHQGQKGLKLEISLVSATDLLNMDVLSLSDPYVIFSCTNHSLRSRTIDDNLNPVWGTPKDVFCFAYQPSGDKDIKREICVDVYDEDPTYDDFLGNTVIDLNQYPDLEKGNIEKVDLPLEPKGSGSIQLDMRVIPVQSSS